MHKVLVVATSRKTRGGITSVIKAHETGEQWNEFHCRWIETHIDKSSFMKLWMLFTGFLKYLFYLPGADLVHFHLSEPTSAKRKRLFIPFALLLKKKIIVHFHAFSPDTTINGKYSYMYRYLFTNADAVIVLSNFWKNIVNEKFNLGDKVIVIFNPCTITLYPAQYEKRKSILYAGTLNQRKGYADLINAFSKIAQKYPEWELTLAGNGDVDNAKTIAIKLGIESQCVFLGWVCGKAKDKAYKEATMFCLPSYAEGFPMAVLDAWAYGLPVITTPVGGIPDVALDGENMLLFEPGDVNGLSRCIEQMITDEKLRKTIGEESKKIANTIFCAKSICKQVGDVYKQLLL